VKQTVVFNVCDENWAQMIVDELCSATLNLTHGGPLGYNIFIETRQQTISKLLELKA
jgi:hypothetical protein